MKILLSMAWALLISAIAATDGHAEEVASETRECATGANCQISFERLSTEESDPFLYFGRTPKELRRKKLGGDQSRHLRAISRFPTVRDCLLPSERTAEIPDLGKFAWKSMPDLDAVEVCVFRVAASIRSVDGMKAWLESQDFRIEAVGVLDYTTVKRWGHDPNPGVSISSGRSVEEDGVFWGRGWYHRNVRHYFSRYLSLNIEFSSKNEPLNVSTYLSHAFSL